MDTLEAKLAKDRKDSTEPINVGLALVKSWKCAVDGGAHVGVVTERLRHYFELVFAFEPGQEVLPYLKTRTDKWSNVALYRQALGDQNKYVWFGHDSKKPNTRSWFADPNQPGDVLMVRLDDFQMTNCGFMKLDLEGGEFAALRGAEETIKRCRPVIVTEAEDKKLLRAGASLGELLKFMRSVHYRLVQKFRVDMVFAPE